MINEKKHQAKTLFFQSGLNNSQIASLLNVSRRSISTWVKEGDWNRLKQSAKYLPSMLAENCYHIIGHLTESYLSESRLTNPVTFKEVEALHKLTITAKKLQNRCTINENMELFGYFMEMVSKRNPELAQTIHPYIDEFISARASVYTQHIQPDTFNSMGRIPFPEEDITEKQLDRQEEYFSDPDVIEAYKRFGIPHPYDEQPPVDQPLQETLKEKIADNGQKNQPADTIPLPSHPDTPVGSSAQVLRSKVQPASHIAIDDQWLSPQNAQTKFSGKTTEPQATGPVKNWKELKITPPPSDASAPAQPAPILSAPAE
ncbi:MAG: hypothetical protein JNM41_02835 [Flavipsychrobacter sp.]|nr:hypothetical protein [Flavipsychrobacter sp.]